MAKDIKISDLSTPTPDWFIGTYDFIGLADNYIELFTEATDTRKYISWAYPPVQKAVVSPVGVAYPGDATHGTGSKRVVISFHPASILTVVHSRCDHVLFEGGWLLLLKGDHIIVYSPAIVRVTDIGPTT